jgi:hypothetical protein
MFKLVIKIVVLILIGIILWEIYERNREIQVREIYKCKKVLNELKEFEKEFSEWYPLGDDYFMISHGDDYLRFFERIGKVRMIGCYHNDKLIGLGIGVLRDIGYEKVWYLADFKINNRYREKHLPYRIFRRMVFNGWFLKSFKFYGICMDGQAKSKIVSTIEKFWWLRFKVGPKLLIYSLNKDEMEKSYECLHKNISYESLLNIKDLTLKSTNKPKNILHLRFDNKGLKKEQGNATYMFCLLENNPIVKQLKNINIDTNISATIVYFNMDEDNFNDILTSEI